MAAITVVTAFEGSYKLLRNVAAQASTGQTDWITVPRWAKSSVVYFDLTANAGTTPISTVSVLSAGPNLRDDGSVVTYVTGAAVTAVSYHEYQVGPYFTTANNDNAASSGFKVQNSPLPAILGVKVLNDRTTGDETYTYTLAVEFKA